MNGKDLKLAVTIATFIGVSIYIAKKIMESIDDIKEDLDFTGMGSYFSNLSTDQKRNIYYLRIAMRKQGITNKFTQAAILAVVSKESNFIPKSEVSYRGTSNDRIRSIFSVFRNYSDDQITEIKNNPPAFFEAIYGGKFGNNSPGDGYKFRGRGYNQLTFKGNYLAMQRATGINLTSNPDVVNRPDVAGMVCVAYFVERFKTMPRSLQTQYKANGLNGFKSLDTATYAIYHANAGWGKNISSDRTGGLAKTTERSPGFYKILMT